MKNLYSFLGILIVCFGMLSGCKTLFDVAPTKEVYSPIELHDDKISIKNSKGSIGKTYGDIATLNFTGKDSSLNYGVIVFYDSIDASNFVRKNIKSNLGVFQKATYLTTQEKISPQPKMTVRVSINRSLGQFQYLVPFGYTRDSLKTFVAQGYIQAKITPWSYVTDVPIPDISKNIYGIKIFQGAGKLSYLDYGYTTYGYENPGLPINCYEYDSTARLWFKKGSILSQISNTRKHIAIGQTGEVLFYKNKYYMISELSGPQPEQSTFSVITLDNNFKYENQSDYFRGSSGTKNTYGTVQFASFNQDVLQIFVNRQSDGLSSTSVAYMSLNSSNIRSSYPSKYNPSALDSTSIFLNISNKIVINKSIDQLSFKTFDLTTAGLDNAISTKLTLPLVGFLNGQNGFSCYSDGSVGYVVDINQSIYKASLMINKPQFENIYSGWFPTNGRTSVLQSIMYKGQLAYLLANYEVWLFDPTQKDIDFTRPGSVSIIPL